MPGDTTESKPRPAMVSAKVPCTSSQARTQREQTMHFDGSKVKYGFEVVEPRIGMVGAVVAVAHLAQADRAGHVLQFAIAVGRAGQAVERMIGDVELHHALAELLQPLGLGVHDHAVGDRRGAGGRRAGAALDLDQAEPAGAERLDHVGGAEFRDLRAASPSRRA